MSTLRTNKKGVHVGIPWESMREYTLLTAPRMLTTGINQTEISILEGDYFTAYTRDDIPNGGTIYYRFVTPAQKFFGFRFIGISTRFGDVDFYIYRNSTGITAGAAVDIHNSNELINTATTATVHAVTSVTGEGDEYFWDQIPSGVGSKPPGSAIDRDGFLLLPPNETLLFKVVNSTTQTNRTRIEFEWFEITPEITT